MTTSRRGREATLREQGPSTVARFVWGCALWGMAALGLAGCAPEGSGGHGPEAAPGQEARADAPEPAPDFTLARLEGGELGLAELRGKIVIIDFWATWCPPCEFQVPELNAFYETHRSESDLAVLGVSVDTDGPEVVAEWAAEHGVKYPILLGGDALARDVGAVGFPTLIVLTPDGNIESQHVGLIERNTLEEALIRLRGRKS